VPVDLQVKSCQNSTVSQKSSQVKTTQHWDI
jgi:hypothetical protein